MRDIVIPALANLPAGAPLVVVVDALDEVLREESTDLLSALSLLALRVTQSPSNERGLGRLRLLFASQPEVPLSLNVPTACVDLAKPSKEDEEALTRYLTTLLHDLDVDARDAFAARIASEARGVWSWATFVARDIIALLSTGIAVEVGNFSYTAPDGDWLRDALDRLQSRTRSSWSETARLLAIVAAVQEVGESLPLDVVATVLTRPRRGAAELVRKAASVVTHDESDNIGFFHPELGRYLLSDGPNSIDIDAAHDDIASALVAVERSEMVVYDYAVRALAKHSVLAAEGWAGRAGAGEKAARAIAVLADVSLFRATSPFPWLNLLDRLSVIVPASTTFPGTPYKLLGLAASIAAALELAVGIKLSSGLSEEQMEEFETLFQAGYDSAEAWLARTRPQYPDVVFAELVFFVKGFVDPSRDPLRAHRATQEAKQLLNSTGQDLDISRVVTLVEEALALHHDRNLMGHAVPSLLSRLVLDGRIAGLTAAQLTAITSLTLRAVSEMDDRDESSTVWAMTGETLWSWALRNPANAAEVEPLMRKAYHEALRRTDVSHGRFTSRLAFLTAAEVSSQVDPSVDIARKVIDTLIVGRPDLSDDARAQASGILGGLLQTKGTAGDEPDVQIIEAAVEAHESALSLTPEADEAHSPRLITLANAYAVLRKVGPHDADRLARAIEVNTLIARRSDLSDEVRAQAAGILGVLLQSKGTAGDEPDAQALEGAVEAHESALALTPETDEQHSARLITLANAYADLRKARPDDADRLARSIEVSGLIVRRSDLSDDVRARASSILGALLQTKEAAGDEPDVQILQAAVEAHESALSLTPSTDEAHSQRLITLANAYSKLRRARPDDAPLLERAIEVNTLIVRRPDLSDDVRAQGFGILGAYLEAKGTAGDEPDAQALEGAVEAHESALALTPETDEQHSARLIAFVNGLWRQALDLGDATAFARARGLARDIAVDDQHYSSLVRPLRARDRW